MCPSVTTDLHTGERAKTGCLGDRIMCPSGPLAVTTQLIDLNYIMYLKYIVEGVVG